MRVLIVTNFFPPDWMGGYELGCAQMAKALNDRGHTVKVMTSTKNFRMWEGSSASPLSSFGSESYIDRCFVLHDVYKSSQYVREIPFSFHIQARVFSRHNMMLLIDRISSFKPDVVYAFNTMGLGVIGIVQIPHLMNVPLVWHLMDSIPAQAVELGATKGMIPLAKTSKGVKYECSVVACAKGVLAEIAAAGVSFESSQVVPNWIDHDVAALRPSYYQPGQKLRVCFAGGLRKDKGVHHIIEGLALLSAENLRDVEVHLYGQGDANEFKAMAQSLSVDKQIAFKGAVSRSELIEGYKNYDLLLFPTWAREPFAFAPMEAASQQCVQAFSDDCGNAEWFINNVDSLQFDRSAEGVACVIRSVMDGRVSLRDIAKMQSERLANKFHLSVVVGQIEQILRSAMKTSSSNPQRTRAWLEQYSVYAEAVTLRYGTMT